VQQQHVAGQQGALAAGQQVQAQQQQQQQQQQEVEQHSNDLYWRPTQLDGVQYLLGCVCLNIFTGTQLDRRYWPADTPLPVLTPVR
jgi:hypothetical protein